MWTPSIQRKLTDHFYADAFGWDYATIRLHNPSRWQQHMLRIHLIQEAIKAELIKEGSEAKSPDTYTVYDRGRVAAADARNPDGSIPFSAWKDILDTASHDADSGS